MFLWAAWFLFFDVSSSSKSYEMFSGVPAYFWGLLFALGGVIRALALIKGGFFFNALGAVFSILLWGTSCVLFGLANFSSHAVPVTFYFTLINCLRLKEVIRQAKN